jgi:Tol biopolymer transport system component
MGTILNVAAGVAAVLMLGAAHGETPSSWTPEFSMQFQTIGPVVPSHDRSWVAWTETRAVMEAERSEEVTQIWVAKIDGSLRRQLTRSEKSSSNPDWSADGK